MSLLALHRSLGKFIIEEAKTKRTLKERIPIAKNVIKGYFSSVGKEIKQYYLLLVDKEYKKKYDEFNKTEKAKREFAKALKVLEYVDKKLDELGFNRTQNRQFWREFSKEKKVRTEVFNQLYNQIGIKD